MIRLNRVACGIVAGTAGIIAGAVSWSLASRISHRQEPRIFWIVFFVVGTGVFALVDWLEVLAPPYESEQRDVLNLNDEHKTTLPDVRSKGEMD